MAAGAEEDPGRRGQQGQRARRDQVGPAGPSPTTSMRAVPGTGGSARGRAGRRRTGRARTGRARARRPEPVEPEPDGADVPVDPVEPVDVAPCRSASRRSGAAGSGPAATPAGRSAGRVHVPYCGLMSIVEVLGEGQHLVRDPVAVGRGLEQRLADLGGHLGDRRAAVRLVTSKTSQSPDWVSSGVTGLPTVTEVTCRDCERPRPRGSCSRAGPPAVGRLGVDRRRRGQRRERGPGVQLVVTVLGRGLVGHHDHADAVEGEVRRVGHVVARGLAASDRSAPSGQQQLSRRPGW